MSVCLSVCLSAAVSSALLLMLATCACFMHASRMWACRMMPPLLRLLGRGRRRLRMRPCGPAPFRLASMVAVVGERLARACVSCPVCSRLACLALAPPTVSPSLPFPCPAYVFSAAFTLAVSLPDLWNLSVGWIGFVSCCPVLACWVAVRVVRVCPHTPPGCWFVCLCLHNRHRFFLAACMPRGLVQYGGSHVPL